MKKDLEGKVERSKPIIICAQQRSGTTVLQGALNDTGLVKNYREVFHDDSFNKKAEFGFFNVKKFLIGKNIDLFFPSVTNQDIIFRRYFGKLKDRSNRPFHLIDIKYNSWHHFNLAWHSSEEIPYLLKLIKKKNIPVIHIIRKNQLHQYISHRYALFTRKWHFNATESLDEKKKIIVNLNDCLNYLNKVTTDIENYKRWMKNYPQYYEIEYEDMIINGKFSGKMNALIDKITNNRIIKLGDPPLKKIIQNPFGLVKNWGAVEEMISESQYKKFL